MSAEDFDKNVKPEEMIAPKGRNMLLSQAKFTKGSILLPFFSPIF